MKINPYWVLAFMLPETINASVIKTQSDEDISIYGAARPVESQHLVDYLKTSSETADRKRSLLTTKYVEEIVTAMTEKVCAVIRREDTSYGLNPENSIKILEQVSIMEVLRVFTDSHVDKRANNILSDAMEITRDWGQIHKDEFYKTNLIEQVKKELFNNIYLHLISEQNDACNHKK